MNTDTSIIEGPRFETAPPAQERRSLLLPIILSLVAVLFLVGGFLLFDSPTSLTPATNISASNNSTYSLITTETLTTNQNVVETTAKSTVTEAVVTSTKVAVIKAAVGTTAVNVVGATSTTGAFILEAQAGDGITHLARRAISRYLTEEGLTSIFTPEHNIYMEDFVKDNIGTGTLAIGQEIVINEALLQKAATKAQALTQAELTNLEQYSALVLSLN